MDNYTISYSRKEKLAQEESLLDTNVEKAKVIEKFNGTTLKQSLKELDDFISDGTIRERVSTDFVLYFITVVGIFLIITTLDTAIATLLAMYAFNKPFDRSMCLALSALLSIPSMVASISIHDKLFPRQDRFDRLKKKTLGTGYEILKDVVDCPIEVKRELWYKLETGYLFLAYNRNNQTLKYFKEDGTEKYVNKKLMYYEDFVYKTEPYKYFVSQLENDKMYKIVDILTDRAFKGEHRGN
jgi:hypothetical protein